MLWEKWSYTGHRQCSPGRGDALENCLPAPGQSCTSCIMVCWPLRASPDLKPNCMAHGAVVAVSAFTSICNNSGRFPRKAQQRGINPGLALSAASLNWCLLEGRTDGRLGTGSSESKTGLVMAVAPSPQCHLGLSRVQEGSWKGEDALFIQL